MSEALPTPETPETAAPAAPPLAPEKHLFARMRDLERDVEAILFAANGPVDATEIASSLDEPITEVVAALERVAKAYQRRNGAIEVATVPKGLAPGWHLRLRDEFRHLARPFIPPEMDRQALETLAVIAINQPVTQAEVVRIRGPRAYAEIKLLAERGYVTRRMSKTKTYHLRTTPRFAADFQIEDDPLRIRETLGATASALLIAPEDREVPLEDAAAPAAPEAAEAIPGGAGPASGPDPVVAGGAAQPLDVGAFPGA